MYLQYKYQYIDSIPGAPDESHLKLGKLIHKVLEIFHKSEIETIEQAVGDNKVVFDYAGETVDMIITYNDASISLDAGGDWLPANTATVTINDPDMNRNPTEVEELSVGNPDEIIPTFNPFLFK